MYLYTASVTASPHTPNSKEQALLEVSQIMYIVVIIIPEFSVNFKRFLIFLFFFAIFLFCTALASSFLCIKQKPVLTSSCF